MKKFYFLVGIISLVLLFSCQSEENTTSHDPNGSITRTSPLAILMSRVSQNATFADNVIDSTSCFSIKLPVTIFVNDQQMVVFTAEDYSSVASIMGNSDVDQDYVDFVYPITVVLKNYEEIIVADAAGFQQVIDDCGPQDEFTEIECIDFNYPISFNTFNIANQAAGSMTVSNDVELYNFLQAASADDMMGIMYPVSVTTYSGQTINASDNVSLEAAIESVIGQCSPENPGPQLSLAEIAMNGTWYISYFTDNEDETLAYVGYVFTFYSGGYLTAVKNGNTFSGNWNVYLEDGAEKMDIDFSDSSLGDLDDEWKVIEYNENNIHLKDQSGGNNDYLYFTKL